MMNNEDILNMFEVIQNVYPNFDITTKKVQVWERIFRDADKRKVIVRLEKHFVESKFAPTPAEIYVEQYKDDAALLKIEAYKKKVASEGEIPQHLKDQMEQALNKMTRKMTQNDNK